MRSHLPKALPQLPVLQNPLSGDQASITNKNKTDRLFKTFFPAPVEADLEDITTVIYPIPIEINREVSEEDVKAAIVKFKPDKVFGPDEISNRVLQCVSG